MSTEILNRREKILSDKIPPEILSEKKLHDDGFVKNTDYATNSKGGVVKADSTYGVTTKSSGKLVGYPRSADQWYAGDGDHDETILCKKTLENIAFQYVQDALVAAFLSQIPNPDTEKLYTVQLYYDGSEWKVEFVEV